MHRTEKPRRDLFPAMRSRDYRRLFYAAGLSAVSLWALITVRGWIAHDLTDSGWAVGVVYFAGIGPWVLAPIGGALADRYDRARVVQVARSGAMVLALLLALLAFLDVIELWSLVLVTLLSGIFRSAEMPAQAALLPNTVGKAALLSAITLASMMQFGSRAIGPVAGPVLAWLGPGPVFLAAGLLLAISVLQLRRIEVRSTGGIVDRGRGVLAEAGSNIREGLAYLGRAPAVRMLIALTALHCMLAMSFDALLVVFAKDVLNGGSTEYGYLLTGVGGGALVATVALSMVPPGRVRGRIMLVTGLLSGITLPIIGLAANFPVAIAGAALAGSSQAMFMALTSTMIQSVVPDAVRGRVMSLYAMFAGGIMAVMILSNGLISDFISVRILLTVPGAIFFVLLLIWAGAGARLRAAFRNGEIPAAAAAVAAAWGWRQIIAETARPAPMRDGWRGEIAETAQSAPMRRT